MDCPARALRRRRRRRRRARAHRHAARSRRATCSSRSRASASTPTTSSREAQAQGAVAALARSRPSPRRGLSGARGATTRCSALGALARRAGARRFALPLDRRHRQQRQDHGHGDDRVDPARLAVGDASLATRGQLQQRHRRAADAAAPARAAHRVARGRARHEPSGRDRASWPRIARADDRAGQQRAARAPGVHGHASRRWRARTARSIAALAADGIAVFPADDALRAAVARAGRAAARRA